MYIIEALPFSKGLTKDSLSYFSADYLEPGSLVKVTVRSKSERALVIKSESVREMKSEIKKADFQLKKISSFVAKPFLQKEFLETIKESAKYFACTEGSILSHLLPSFILENPLLLPKTLPLSKATFELPRPQKVAFDSFVLQASDEERFAHYKSLIREEFAKKHSVFICLPQNKNVKEVKAILERGIEIYVAAFHKDLNKKELKEEWKKASLQNHPVLVISTARFLFLPRDDFGTLIIDKENENGWKTFARPFIDLRFFAETLANKKNIRCILGDSFLRIETLYRHEKREVKEFERIKWKSPSNTETKVIDIKEMTKKEKEYRALSPQILTLIKQNMEKGSHLFIFAARKGLSSVTICRDCGHMVKCLNCSSPMILYKKNPPAGGGAFKCHQCGETRDAAEYCQNCKSWKLAAFGSGIERVALEIKKNFPEIILFEIHKDLTAVSTKAENVAKKFFETRGSVLLGTEMAFSYIHKKVSCSVIASFDSLFSVPDFRIREKIFHIILQTKNLAKEKFLIQTRNPDDLTLKFAVEGDLLEFYKKEIEDRKILGYPPVGTFIKITVRGGRGLVAREEENLKKIFAEWSPAIFHSIHEKHGEQAAVNAVIKLPREEWINFPLLSLLKSLPPSFEIKVDPDNLL